MPQERDKARKPPRSTISMDSPVAAEEVEHVNSEETGSKCEQSFDATSDVGGLRPAAKEDSLVALDTSAVANLVCSCWLEDDNRHLEKSPPFPPRQGSALAMGVLVR